MSSSSVFAMGEVKRATACTITTPQFTEPEKASWTRLRHMLLPGPPKIIKLPLWLRALGPRK